MSFTRRIFRQLRSKDMLNWMPDSWYLKLCYHFAVGKSLDLKNPKTFNEKLQWLKIHDRKDIYTTMVDKYEAKNYVAGLVGQEHVIPVLGVWESFKDINFDTLPEEFVLKCTHDSGGLIICKDKSKLDMEFLDKTFTKLLSTNYYYAHREWPYKNVKPRIIAEKLMKDDADTEGIGLMDHKFYCFNGEPKYLYISVGFSGSAFSDEGETRISFLDMDWKPAPFGRSDYKELDELPQKPSRFEDMVELARFFSKGTKFLRVDMYQINGEIYLSEFTFTPSAGYMPISPVEYERILGDEITL